MVVVYEEREMNGIEKGKEGRMGREKETVR